MGHVPGMMASALAVAATNGTDWTAIAALAGCATVGIYVVLRSRRVEAGSRGAQARRGTGPAPGKKIRVLFDSFSDRLDAGLPLTYDVTLCYRGPTGRKPWKEPYRLDLGMYLGSEPVKGIPDLVAELGNIRKEIEKWKGSGIVVHAIGQQRQDRIKTRRMNAHILRQQGRRALARTL